MSLYPIRSPWHDLVLSEIEREVLKYERMEEWGDVRDTAYGMLEMGHITFEMGPEGCAQLVAQGIYEALGGFEENWD